MATPGRFGTTVAVDRTIEILLAEFNEHLRVTGQANYSLLDHCPVEQRAELRSLFNTVVLAFAALAPEREAYKAAVKVTRAS
ncbi:MAG: hypothetical protein U0002_01890 [Thermoanaerobaculia bacterium]